MKILITEMDDAIAQWATTELAVAHEVVRCDPAVDLRDPSQVAPLVDGVQAVIHTALPERIAQRSFSDEDLLDWAARSAFVLLQACRNAQVDRAVLLSTLAPFDDYPANYIIDETWRPRPRAEAASLAPLMAERTFREFAREGGIRTICLRFGALDAPDGTPLSLATQSIERALTMPIDPISYRWWLFHIAESERYPMRTAQNYLFSDQEAA